MRFLHVWAYIAGLCAMSVLAQANDPAVDSGPDVDSGIRVSTFADQVSVPQNRTVIYTIRLEWYGDLDRYTIGDFENPVVRNMEIIATASANKVSSSGGQRIAIQDFQYTLRPQSLGMAYVDGGIIAYTDAATQKDYRLMTKRLEIKVVEPVPEPGSKNWVLWLALVLATVASVVCGVRHRQKKAALRLQLEKESAAANIPLEAKILEDLPRLVNLKESDLDVGGAISNVSKLIRRYLTQKYQISVMEKTTEELVAILHEQPAIDERFQSDIAEILRSADYMKFSGGAADRSTLERMYTLFEAGLQRQKLQGSAQASKQLE